MPSPDSSNWYDRYLYYLEQALSAAGGVTPTVVDPQTASWYARVEASMMLLAQTLAEGTPGGGSGSVDLSNPGPIGGGTPNSAVFTQISANLLNLLAQSSKPTYVSGRANTFADSSGRLSMLSSGGFSAGFDLSGLTNDRVYSLPNQSGTLATTTDVQSATYLGLAQSGFPPSTPSQGVRIFSYLQSSLAWRSPDGFIRQINGTLTADRTYTLPNKAGTFALIDDLGNATKIQGKNIATPDTTETIPKYNGTSIVWVPMPTGGSGSADWANPGAIGTGTPNTAIFTGFSVQSDQNIVATFNSSASYYMRVMFQHSTGAGFGFRTAGTWKWSQFSDINLLGSSNSMAYVNELTGKLVFALNGAAQSAHVFGGLSVEPERGNVDFNPISNPGAGNIAATGFVKPGSYAQAQLPSPSAREGAILYCNDLSGGATPVYSDGTQWRRLRVIGAASSSSSYYTYLSSLTPDILLNLEDWAGNLVFDRSGNVVGFYSGNFAQQRPSLISDATARSVLFRTGGVLLDGIPVVSGSVVSSTIVCRFKASSDAQGVLFSYGNTADFSPASYDRVVYLNGNSLSVYGYDMGAGQPTNLDSSLNVRDGQNHTLVARFSGLGVDVWLDNTKIIDDPRMIKADYAGYWRIAHGLIFGSRSSLGGFARGVQMSGFATFSRLLQASGELQAVHTNV